MNFFLQKKFSLQTRNPHAVQPHLRKCFDAITRLEFGVVGGKNEQQLTTDISAMLSPEGERVPLGKVKLLLLLLFFPVRIREN